MAVLDKLFGSENDRKLKDLRKIVSKIEALDSTFATKSDNELKAYTEKLRNDLKNGKTTDDILPEAYALVREATSRVLGLKHRDVQLIGGVALHQGRIAEMMTGEGKTIVCLLPAFLNALNGNGVHVVTANEYLAERDAESMGKVHSFLGLNVGLVTAGKTKEEKQDAYNCDITYGTCSEFGFDFLRDNMSTNGSEKLQRDHSFVIIDEVDSILIDEARTPLIISGKGTNESVMFTIADRFVKTLKDEDFDIDLKENTINLTESGISKAEQFYRVDNIYDQENLAITKYIDNALRANYLLLNNVDYVVKNKKIELIDAFTGRILDGRKFSKGLHQAIEAKEGASITSENKTLATISIQNYFRNYGKISGMTGTALSEQEEFNQIYNLDVVSIPPYKRVERIDQNDKVYLSREAKIRAIVEEVKTRYAKGQPVLVGTITIEQSEEISKALEIAGIPHNVLNAKNYKKEGDIIAQAGRYQSVTIATNMAGRGTDIALGGNAEYLAKDQLIDEGVSEEQISIVSNPKIQTPLELDDIKARYFELLNAYKTDCKANKQQVIDAGGLCVIGTERHESRRIDNQLRGRSGRQGDVGETMFFLSLDDDLIKIFGGEKLKSISTKFKLDENEPLSFSFLTKQIEKAQKQVESIHFSQRKSVVQFGNVINEQRKVLYDEREKILQSDSIHSQLIDMIQTKIDETLDNIEQNNMSDAKNINTVIGHSFGCAGLEVVSEQELSNGLNNIARETIKRRLIKLYETYCEKSSLLGVDIPQHEKEMFVKCMDEGWIEHIDYLNDLREGIGLLAYAQKDPIQEFNRECYKQYELMVNNVQADVSALSIGSALRFMVKEAQQKRIQEIRKEQQKEKSKKLSVDDDKDIDPIPQVIKKQSVATTQEEKTPNQPDVDLTNKVEHKEP